MLSRNTTEFAPLDDVTPVPPFATGNAVPEYVNANVPEDVTGLPLTVNIDGADNPTLVTVPNGFVAHDVSVPSVVRYFPELPV